MEKNNCHSDLSRTNLIGSPSQQEHEKSQHPYQFLKNDHHLRQSQSCHKINLYGRPQTDYACKLCAEYTQQRRDFVCASSCAIN